MTDKEFRHLSRGDLIEIIYQLQKNELSLRQELERTRHELAAKKLKISEAGSIAEATVSLSGIFETAQKTADEYLAQIAAMRSETARILLKAREKEGKM